MNHGGAEKQDNKTKEMEIKIVLDICSPRHQKQQECPLNHSPVRENDGLHCHITRNLP